ncbi:hypothetical protein D3C74_14340 [compost metagenome]
MEHQNTSDLVMLAALLRILELGVDARTDLTDKQIVEISRFRTRNAYDLQTRIGRRGQTSGHRDP